MKFHVKYSVFNGDRIDRDSFRILKYMSFIGSRVQNVDNCLYLTFLYINQGLLTDKVKLINTYMIWYYNSKWDF